MDAFLGLREQLPAQTLQQVGYDDQARRRLVAESENALTLFGIDVGDGKQDQAHILFGDQVRDLAGCAKDCASLHLQALPAGVIIHHADDGKRPGYMALVKQPDSQLAVFPRAHDQEAFADGADRAAVMQPARSQTGEQAVAITHGQKTQESQQTGDQEHAGEQHGPPGKEGPDEVQEQQEQGGQAARERQIKCAGGRRLPPGDAAQAQAGIDQAEAEGDRQGKANRRLQTYIQRTAEAPEQARDRHCCKSHKIVDDEPGEVAAGKAG